jgi:hypothetical protein
LTQPYGPYPGPPQGGWPPPAQPPGPPPGAWPPPWGYGPPPAPSRRNRRAVVGWTVAGVLLAVTVLAIIAVGGVRMGSDRVAGAFAAPSTSPPADWTAVGEDEGLDPYAQRCHDGEMQACDELYTLADPGSDYEYYALTCGGRVKPRDVQWCALLD